MKSVTIAGPIEQFYSILEKYVCDKQIHLEDALSVLSKREKLYQFEDASNYDPVLKRIEDISEQSGLVLTDTEPNTETDYSLENMNMLLSEVEKTISDEREHMDALENQLNKYAEVIEKLKYFRDMDIDFSKLLNFKFMSFAFGCIPRSSYTTLTTYLSDLDVIFVKTKEDSQKVWGFYFSPASRSGKVDEVFASLYFEEVEIPPECAGVPAVLQSQYLAKIAELRNEIAKQKESAASKIAGYDKQLLDMYIFAQKGKKLNNIKKKAVHSKDFFYIVGWMPGKDVKKLNKQIEGSNEPIMFVATEPDKSLDVKPPTLLHNNPIFKPFEMFVKMYGLPDYREIDPTPILAITYILFFGIMFGDVGQSAIFAIVGLLLYKKTKKSLLGVIGMVGLSGVVFGFVYGSLFGIENGPLHSFVSPMHQASQLLAITIGVGMCLIVIGIVLNIINSFKDGRMGDAIFGHNGIAGLIFYTTILAFVLSKLVPWFVMPTKVVVIVTIVTLLCMFLKDPLGKLVTGEKHWLPKDGMFYVESLFELFEVLLSYFTNTISFLRIGAFSVVHVGMMMVVNVLAFGGNTITTVTVNGIIIDIIGNIIVMGLEGLIVGIQVLRLEYYEMFSRYFTGDGREFVSVNDKNQ